MSDALMSVEAGADALGFNFWRGSARFVEPSAAREIIERLPESVLCVGVFVNEDAPETVERVARRARVGAVQLHGDETPDYCRAVRGQQVIKALRVGEGFRPEDVSQFETGAVLLDSFSQGARGGTGRTFDWTIARRVRALVPELYLAGGLTVENVAEAIAAVGPFAVDVCSGVESAPGRKDAARVRAFVAAARGAKVESLDG
ncbi:MAG TPA: phosphoribosylanthranilate isomerase [Pyrinomonadaceae bacterium]|nr:phosphoribosylanthranilate isomerase [Pyrinomonadaceae bacterium]